MRKGLVGSICLQGCQGSRNCSRDKTYLDQPCCQEGERVEGEKVGTVGSNSGISCRGGGGFLLPTADCIVCHHCTIATIYAYFQVLTAEEKLERRRQEEEARAARFRESEERRQMLAAAAVVVTSSDQASSSDKENKHHIMERAQVRPAVCSVDFQD